MNSWWTRKPCYRKDDPRDAPNIWMPWKVSRSLDTPTLHFLSNFYRAFVRMDPVNIPAKFEVRSFTHSWDNRGYSKNLELRWRDDVRNWGTVGRIVGWVDVYILNVRHSAILYWILALTGWYSHSQWKSVRFTYKMPRYRRDHRAMRPIYECPENNVSVK